MEKMNVYPSIATLDVKSTRDWSENYQYYIEEKIDGSQLSIVIVDGKLSFYNKHSRANMNNAFEKAITMLTFKYEGKDILNANYIYHGESVCRIKHNVCVYERTPKHYFILYDIFDVVKNEYVSSEAKIKEAERVGFEMVPILYQNQDPNQNPYEICEKLFKDIEEGKITSCLGGIVEGIVLKHHAYYKKGKYVATKLKLVTKNFKERHAIKLPKAELSADEFLESLGKSFCTEARFQKSLQHLIERDEVPNAGKMIAELNADFDKEYKEELSLLLYTEFSPLLKKLAREGVTNWFNNKI